MLERLRRAAAAHAILGVAALAAAAVVVTGRVPAGRISRVEDGRLLGTLFALLLSVELVRASGLLDAAVRRAVARFSSARSLCLALIALSGGLSAVVTNDVALFVVIPITVAAQKHSNFRVRNAVILEIVAANLLGCLTPVGNPQNLFLYRQSGLAPARFVLVMAPFVAAAAVLLLAALFAMEPRRRIEPVGAEVAPVLPVAAALGCAGVGLVVLEIAGSTPPWIAPAYAAAAAAAVLGRRALRADLSIVALFFFVFIDIAALHSGSFPRIFAALPGSPSLRLYVSGALASQVISNVPAAVLLAPFAGGRHATLLYAVNAGGCGTIVASLANLLGWRIYAREAGPDAVFFRRFLAVNLAFFAGMGVVGGLLGVT